MDLEILLTAAKAKDISGMIHGLRASKPSSLTIWSTNPSYSQAATPVRSSGLFHI